VGNRDGCSHYLDRGGVHAQISDGVAAGECAVGLLLGGSSAPGNTAGNSDKEKATPSVSEQHLRR
jgi:hypothetical protein